MTFNRLTDGIARRIEETLGVTGTLFEPVTRLGVTGLSRSGKTVFITSLVANLIDRGRMPQLTAAASHRILAASHRLLAREGDAVRGEECLGRLLGERSPAHLGKA